MINSSQLDDLPEKSAIYRVWHSDRIVYVGQAKNLRKRWKNHHILNTLYQRYQNDWQIDWVIIKDPKNLSRAEAFAYRTFKPELNQRNPSLLLGSSKSSVTLN